MKTFTTVIAKFLLGVLALSLSSCENNASTNAECIQLKKEIKQLEKQIVLLEKQVGSAEQPKNIISSKTALELFTEYNKRAQLIDKVEQTDANGKPFKATRSMFYPIDQLRNYLAYIYKISNEAGVTPSGYRFYFAKYPDPYDERKLYAKRQTIFIAPTVEKKDEQGNIKHLSYLFDKDQNITLLDPILEERQKNQKEGQDSNLLSTLEDPELPEISTIANELSGTPPMNTNE